jgi:glycosyltransferase Alg8
MDELGQNQNIQEVKSMDTVDLFFAGFLILCLISFGAYLFTVLPNRDYTSNVVFFTIGIIGIWRYSWLILNIFRAFYYKKYAFFKYLNKTQPTFVSDLRIMITTYGQKTEEIITVYKNLFVSIDNLNCQSIVVAAVKDDHQIGLINALRISVNSKSKIIFLKQKGIGKRDALADIIKELRRYPLSENSYTVVMDGDVIVTPFAIERSLAVLSKNEKIFAVTANEIPIVSGSKIFKIWRQLRSAQRDVLMSSFSLSRRILVLTGRFSVYKSNKILTAATQARMRQDVVFLREYGMLPLLTGDDKTFWLEILRQNGEMVYIPDAYTFPLEFLAEDKNFVSGTWALMARYNGNMVRANSAFWNEISLQQPFHFIYGLLDQRLSAWSGLLAPMLLIILFFTAGFETAIFLLLYIIFVKNIQAFFIWRITGFYHPLSWALIAYNQISGSILKVIAFSYPHKQKWNNQKISINLGEEEMRLSLIGLRKLVLYSSSFFIFLFVLTRLDT